MDNNGDVGLDDTEIAEREDEKVVTMMDVLKEQEDFEEDANAVLGASDDKNCTYSMGYIKRQAIYACMTCNSNAKEDPTQRAGVCLACSLKCHEDHELVELYTKRNFRCDCGNPKFKSHPCHFTPNKPDLNEGNSYNQNFSGLYCICQRPYPDPEVAEEDDMIQCIICEDWLHSAHLDATVPDNDQYAEMICKQCMEKNNFLHNYGDLVVNSEADAVDISMNGNMNTDTNEKTNSTNVDVLDGTNKIDELKINSITKETTNENEFNHLDQNKPDDSTNASLTQAPNNLDSNVMVYAEAESEGISKNSLSQEYNTVKDQDQQHQKVTSVNILQNDNMTGNENSEMEHSKQQVNKDIREDLLENVILNVHNSDSNTSNTENSITCTVQETHINENRVEKLNEMDGDTEIRNAHEKSCNEQFDAKEDAETELRNNKVGSSSEAPVSTQPENQIEKDRLVEDLLEPKNIPENNIHPVYSNLNEIKTKDTVKVGMTTDKISNTSLENIIPDGAEPLHLKDTDSNADSNQKVSPIDNNIDELSDLGSAHKNESMSGDKMEVTYDTKLPTIPDTMQEMGKSEYKRKLSFHEKVNNLESKKPKLDSKPCSKPQDVKQRYIGATFWPAHFRQKLCTCNECLSMYKDLSVLFLIDPEDTVSAYEHLGKAKTKGKPASEYEKGLEALSSLDRVQQINALTEYNKMRDKLLDFLKSFKDRKEVVKEEDIKAFFAGMKPKREPDGVYFCR